MSSVVRTVRVDGRQRMRTPLAVPWIIMIPSVGRVDQGYRLDISKVGT
jgi:hypothetical protein